MAQAKKKQKDQQMARAIKDQKRDTGRCPVCYKVVKNGTHPGVRCFGGSE